MILKFTESGTNDFLKIQASNNNFVTFTTSEDGSGESSVEMYYDDEIPKIIELLKRGLLDYNNMCNCSAFDKDIRGITHEKK